MRNRYLAVDRRTRRRPVIGVEPLEGRELPATTFQISLTPNSPSTVEVDSVIGDTRGGVAVSPSHVFYTGDNGTGKFQRTDLSAGTGIGRLYDTLTSNLHTQAVYVLGTNATTPMNDNGGNAQTVTHLLEVHGTTGELTGNAITLSAPVNLTGEVGVYAGYDRVLLHPENGNVFEVAIPSGTVTPLRAIGLTTPTHNPSDISFYFGIAEHFGAQDYLTYVKDFQTIARTQVSTGITDPTIDFEFTNLGDTAAITLSLPLNRWYFETEGPSQFASPSSEETLGFANMTWSTADILVTTLSDNFADPGTTLREAVTQANTTTGLNTIGFQAGLTGPINLTGGPISISESVNIEGPGKNVISVIGNATNRFFVDGSGGAADVSLRGLTLRNAAGFNFPYDLTVEGDLTIDAVASNIAFTGSLTVNGAELTLTDGNQVELGPLTTLKGGALTTANGVLLASGDTLTGDGGSLTGAAVVQSGGNISPGPDTAALTINGNLQFETGGKFTAQLQQIGNVAKNDQLIVNGTLNLGTGANFDSSLLTPSPVSGTSFLLFRNDGTETVNGTLNGARNRSGFKIGGTIFQVRYDGGDGNDVELVVNTAPTLNTRVATNLNPIIEDAPSSSNKGTTVDDILGTPTLYTDPEGTDGAGIAVTGLDIANGNWGFSRDGGTNWTLFETVSDAQATVLVADGSGQNRVRFVPNKDYFGTSTLSFRGWDTTDGSDDGESGVDTTGGGNNAAFTAESETASIQVFPINDQPTASNDSYTLTSGNATLTVPVGTGVLANDEDVDGPPPLKASLLNGAAHGVVSLNDDGSFDYTPTAGFSGIDTFSYKVRDGDGAFDVASVSIDVQGTRGSTLQALDDSVLLIEDGGPQDVPVLDNDIGATLVIQSSTQGQHGTVVIAPDGLSMTYEPDPQFNGVDSFSYTITDGTNSDTARVIVTVLNDAQERGEVVTSRGTTTFVEGLPTALPIPGTGPVTVDPDVLVGSGHENIIKSARVQIVSGFVRGRDRLLFTTLTLDSGRISGKYNARLGVLSLSGIASPDDYEIALRTVKYNNIHPAPVDGIRKISFQVADAMGAGEPSNRLLRVIGINTPPVLGRVPATALTYRRGALGIKISPALTLKDLDNTRIFGLRVMIGAGFVEGKDLLSVVQRPGFPTTPYDPTTGVLTLDRNASLATYLAILRSLRFSTAADAPAGDRTIVIEVFDGQDWSNQVTRTINVTL